MQSSYWGGVTALWEALLAGDSWMLSQALSHPAAYIVGAVLIIPASFLVLAIFKLVPVLDRRLERSVLVATYLTIAAVIFVEVIRRFVFQVQAAWSTTLPPFLFLIMTWVGCSYNVKLRTHLAFNEFRLNLPRNGQFACCVMDAVLWLSFGLIVIVTTLRQTVGSAANFQFLLGTDNVMQWWFYICVPLSWLILSARVIENLQEDYRNYRSGEELFKQTAPMGD